MEEKTFKVIRTLGWSKGMPILLQAEFINGVANGIYCVQYRGGGHYIGTKQAAQEYALRRWGNIISIS